LHCCARKGDSQADLGVTHPHQEGAHADVLFRFQTTRRYLIGKGFEMENNRVLIVSESPDRRNFLAYHVKFQHLTPVWYPNILSAVKAIRLDPFFMVVVDLSLPVEPKLALVQEAYHHQLDPRVITIEKQDYLRNTGVLSPFPCAVSIDSIESFPEQLQRYGSSTLNSEATNDWNVTSI
jgi:hypothetical protein